MEIKSAFLQGKKFEREVYVWPPEDIMKQGKIWDFLLDNSRVLQSIIWRLHFYCCNPLDNSHHASFSLSLTLPVSKFRKNWLAKLELTNHNTEMCYMIPKVAFWLVNSSNSNPACEENVWKIGAKSALAVSQTVNDRLNSSIFIHKVLK